MNKELQSLYEQDQANRRAFEQLDHEQRQQMFQRDRQRRQRVEELIESAGLEAPEDYFHAAMVFQHERRWTTTGVPMSLLRKAQN